MKETLTPDLCVIGAGAGGLAVAAGAVQMGASVVLVERGRMGGDCLNYGCVPSKSLLAAAKLAHVWQRSPAFGIRYRSEEHTSELQSRRDLVCRHLPEKKKLMFRNGAERHSSSAN